MRIRKESGFTLLELLTCVSIVGVLSAVAAPQFSGYRAPGYDARAQSDLRNIAIAEEAYFANYFTYKSCNQDTCPLLLPELKALSDGVIIDVVGDESNFEATSSHPLGTGKTFSRGS